VYHQKMIMLKQIKEYQLFSAILLINTLLVIIHLAHTYYGVPANDFFDLEIDGSLSEIFIYLQELGIVLILFWFYRKYDNQLYLAWALIFTYILIDDSLQLHERLGVWMAEAFDVGNNYGVRGRDITEVIVQFIFGVPLIGFAGWAHLFRGDAQAKRISLVLLGSLVVLVAFAIVLDWFHVKIMVIYLKPILGTIEDGAEIFVITGILWYLYRQWQTQLAIDGC